MNIVDFKESISHTNKIGISTKVKRMQDEGVNYSDESFNKVFKLFDDKLYTTGMERPFLLIFDESEMPQGQLAAYNPRSNSIFLRAGAVDDHSILEQLKAVKQESLSPETSFACEDDPLSTAVHENTHWYFQQLFAQKYSIDPCDIDALSDKLRSEAEDVILTVMETSEAFDFEAISGYAEEQAFDKPEEVIAESFTRELLGRSNQESRFIYEEVGR